MKLIRALIALITLAALVSVASAALPETITASIHNPGSSSYWDVDIASGGTADLPNANNYDGWCSDFKNTTAEGSHTYKVYSSLGYIPPEVPSANWRKINYLINHRNTTDPGMGAFQAAIWHYDGVPTGYPSHSSIGSYNPQTFDAYIHDADAAIAADPAYTPGTGDMYAVILFDRAGVQTVFIEVPVPDIPVPEFPTVALPVGMLVGMVYLVYIYRTRDY